MSTTQAAGAAGHTRLNGGVLADLEKRTLIWLAHRLPAWLHSDHLSALGLAGMFGVGAAFAAGGTHTWVLPLVVVALAVNWFGDSLDGTVARVRGHERPRYGYYVDHVLDMVGTAVLFGGLVLGGHMRPTFATVLLSTYFAVMAETFLATAARGRFRMSFMGIGPTELRVLLGAGALALMRDPRVSLGALGTLQLFDVGAAVATVGLVVAFVGASVANGRALSIEEPRPGPATRASRVPVSRW
jgi:phosphatidylglycerophosphate synthase